MEIDLSYMGFEETGAWGVLCYDGSRGVIEICQAINHSEEQRIDLEERIEALLSHETMHAVLHKTINRAASRRYDLLGEHVYNTPYSFPQGVNSMGV